MKRHALTMAALLSLAPTVAWPQDAAPTERLTLDAAIRTALANNRQVRSAFLQVEQADAAVETARTRRLPSFDVQVSASQLLTPVEFGFPRGAFGTFPGTGPVPATDTSVSVERQPTAYISSQVSQPLSQLGRIKLGVDSAATARDVELERSRATRLSIANSVTRAYLAILQTQSALAVTADTLALYQELGRTVEVRVAEQVALKADALDVQFRLAQEELTRATYVNALATQKEQLNRLLGRSLSTPFEVVEVPELTLTQVDLPAARARAAETRPDVQEARAHVRQAELQQRIARAERVPDVSLSASYVTNINVDVLPMNLATAGVRVTWEPFDWGRRRHSIASKTLAVEQARLAAKDVEDRATLDVNARFRTLTEQRARLRVARLAQDVARERLRVKTNQYQVRTAILPDVLHVRAELAHASDGYQQALAAFWTAKADLDLAIGEDAQP